MFRFLAALLAAILFFAAAPAFAADAGLLRGTVRLNNAPVAGARVVLQGQGQRMERTTDASGRFVFSQVPFGTYVLTASGKGIAAQPVSVSLSSGQVLTLDLALGALKVIGAVTAHAGASGTPVSMNDVSRRQISELPTGGSLNKLIETVPGIVPFSYNEPVAHGFHGVTYEIDGAPLPLATSSNFAEILDPHNIDSLEVSTGAMPAEYGGSREGAVINIISDRASDLTVPYQGYLTAGGGSYGGEETSLDNAFKTGNSEIFFNANAQTTQRGLDAPTTNPQHDASSQSDQFLRTITSFNDRESLAFDFSNQLSQFQIPINTNPNDADDPQFSVPGTDDVQREYDRYASLNFTRSSKDGSGIFQLIPWVRYTRIAYGGDLPDDVLGLTNIGPDATDPGLTDYQSTIGLQQDRRASYVGLRASQFRASAHHAIKIGIDASREVFTADQTFACYDPTCNTVTTNASLPPVTPTEFSSAQNQAGAQIGLYAQDKWSPTRALSVNYGLRYDHSTGYTAGDQLSPRIGVNYAPDNKNILHAYYGRFYAAPQLEDVRAACVALQGCATTPTYDLKPETDSYFEMGLHHTFSPGLNGYVNTWERNVSNVLDTTQLLNTPLFAVYNNAIGRAEGLEMRLQGAVTAQDSWFLSGTLSHSEAAGISGSTFLFPPDQVGGSSAYLISQLSPEDHDETVALNGAFTHRWGAGGPFFTTLQAEYGTGFPVSFQGQVNGTPVSLQGRLPTHLTFDYVIGRDPGKNGSRSLGWNLDFENLLNDRYIIKIANGFNTTQIATGRTVTFSLTAPL